MFTKMALKPNPNSLSVVCFVLLLSACNSPESTVSKSKSNEVTIAHEEAPKSIKYRDIEWTELMPKEDLEALTNPPQEIMDIPDGSEMDQISGEIANTIAQAGDSRYQQALTSTNVVDAFNNQHIRIPGFIVPIDVDINQNTTTFFLVPFFGACIHVPPPPPNQIILVDFPEGIKATELYDAFHVSGLLTTSLFQHQMASSAYSLKATKVEPYIEPGSGVLR